MQNHSLQGKRKRKRRRQDKVAIPARLVVDDHVKEDIGMLSEDLFANLFPASVQESADSFAEDDSDLFHVAITPWGPSTLVEDYSWTLIPIKPSSTLAHSTVQISPSSLAFPSFAEALHKVAPSKLSSYSRSGIEIRILDAVPLPLDTVFVAIETELVRRLENGEGTFHAESSQSHRFSNGSTAPASPHDLLLLAVREALASLKIVHTGDLFSLPLQPHPITHLPPAPARVTLCEPVGQGTLSPRSKIIITHAAKHARNPRRIHSLPVKNVSGGITEEDEDTSNDQFYSAAEDRFRTDTAAENGSMLTETELSSAENDDFSDESMDDIISLQVPMLPVHNVSGTSTMQPITPQTIGRGRRMDGISTPGSVFSSLTATTNRASVHNGRLFKTQPLLRPIAEEILYPRPENEDDDEARIFVDISSLTKIGCFSGDWVRFEAAAEPPAQGAGLWGLGSFGNIEYEEVLWRPVKVFGLPESFSRRSVIKIPSKKHEERRTSFFESQMQKPSNPTVYLSPILLANMANTPYCRISALKRAPQLMRGHSAKITSASRPPLTRDLTLVKVLTPFSTERPLQNAFFAGLQQHFARRTRIVKKGDLVCIAIDETLARTVYKPAGVDDLEIDDVLICSSIEPCRSVDTAAPTGVAWFKINHVGVFKEGDESNCEDIIWNGVAAVEASSTRISQSGSQNCRLPASLDNPWEYYLGLKSTPKFDHHRSKLPELRNHPISTLQRRLRELIAAAVSPRAIHLNLKPLAILLHSSQRNIGKAMVSRRACADIGLHLFEIDAYDIVSEGSAGSELKTVGLLEARAERAMNCGPECCALLIRHIEALTTGRMITTLSKILAGSRVLIVTSTEVDKIANEIRGMFTQELEMNAPDEWERESILRDIIDSQLVALAPVVDLGSVAVKTAALVAGDLVDVVDRALVERKARLEALASTSSDSQKNVTVRDVLVAGGTGGRFLTKGDLDLAVDAARKNFADAIGAPKIPNVSWDDVGGLTNVKDAVMETIQLPLERPELFSKGMKKRSGILFYGPPGTGKTLLAKAIATEFSLNFFSVKGPELLNMYIGESEANVRRVFQRARDARPCVVFFDELDSVAPKRGNQGDSGGVMDRIVSQLLAELDGMSDGEDGGGGVFVIGATNRPDLLDAALLRPGRFDKMLYLGVSDTHEKQLKIMEALTRKFTLHPDLSLQHVASSLPFTYTGADFYALCSDAMLKAVTRQASMVDIKISEINKANSRSGKGEISTAYFFDHYATKEDVEVVVTEADFWGAEKELVPSVSMKELEHYKRVRAQFEKVEDDDTEIHS